MGIPEYIPQDDVDKDALKLLKQAGMRVLEDGIIVRLPLGNTGSALLDVASTAIARTVPVQRTDSGAFQHLSARIRENIVRLGTQDATTAIISTIKPGVKLVEHMRMFATRAQAERNGPHYLRPRIKIENNNGAESAALISRLNPSVTIPGVPGDVRSTVGVSAHLQILEMNNKPPLKIIPTAELGPLAEILKLPDEEIVKLIEKTGQPMLPLLMSVAGRITSRPLDCTYTDCLEVPQPSGLITHKDTVTGIDVMVHPFVIAASIKSRILNGPLEGMSGLAVAPDGSGATLYSFEPIPAGGEKSVANLFSSV